jgi:putative polyhydroxyalkanoate system protein
MADLHIVRDHTLGLAKARKLAFKWAEQVEADFAMQCNYSEGKHEDEVDFVRTGIKGRLVVTKDRFDLQAQLDFFLGAFKASIEAEIVKHLDALLAASPSPDKAATKKRSAHKASR